MINHKLFFNNQEFQLSIEYGRFLQIFQKIPQEVGITLIKNEIYVVQSKVSLNVFQDFLKFWQYSQELEINYDNFFEYYLLNQEFGIMQDILEKFNEDGIHLSIINYIEKFYPEGNQENALFDKSNQERYIATNLDLFVEKYGDHISKIPFNSLVNIFFHKDRILIDQQKAFDFINNLISSTSNSNYSILLSSLNSEKLNQESVIESMTKADEHFGFHPKFSPSFFNKFKKDEKTYQLLLNKIIFTAKLHDFKSSDIIKFIINDECYDVNSKIIINEGTDEITVLHFAIGTDDLDTTTILLQRPDLNINLKTYADGKELTTLYFAIENKNYEIIKRILAMPDLDINLKSNVDGNELTPLHFAIENKNYEIIKRILAMPDLDINLKSNVDGNELTPLHFAIEKEDTEIISFILSHPKLDINACSIFKEEKKDNEKYLLFSKEEESLDLELCKKKEIAPLHFAIEKRNKDIILLLLSRPDLDINIKMTNVEIGSITSIKLSSSAIKFANSLIESAESIINSKEECRKTLNTTISEEKTALCLAVEKKFNDIIPFLLGRSDIGINIKSKQSLEIKSIIKNEKVLEGEGRIEKSALDLAIKYNNFEIAKLLMARHDLDINNKMLKETSLTCSLLAFAIYESFIKSKKMSSFTGIEKFAFKPAIRLKSKKEIPTFYRAIHYENIDIIKLFLKKHNLDVNAKTLIKNPKCIFILSESEQLIIRQKLPEVIDSMEKLIREKNEEERIKIIREQKKIFFYFLNSVSIFNILSNDFITCSCIM